MKKLLLLVLLLISTPAFSTEYLVSANIQGKNLGQFIVSEENGEYFAEQAFFEKLKLPVKEPMPLTFLSKYGTYEFNRVTQNLVFVPDKPEWFAEMKKRTAENKTDGEQVKSKNFDLKSIDYQVNSTYSKSSAPVYSLFGTATGRLYIADIDANFSTMDGKSTGTAQYHDETNKYIRDVQIGAIPQYGIQYGISASNEPVTRYQGGFGSQSIFVNYPIDTMLELFQNGNYLGTFTVNSPNFKIDLDLAYGTSDFLLVAHKPDGNIEEKHIRKSVDSYMVQPGRFEYLAAYGTDINNDQQYKIRAAYGVKSWMTLFTEDDVKLKSIGGYFKINDDLMITTKVFNDGIAGELSYSWQWLDFKGIFNNRTSIQDRLGIIGIKTFLNPVFKIYKNDLTDTQKYSLQISQTIDRFRVTPFFEQKSISNVISRTAGVKTVLGLPNSYRLQGDYAYEDNRTQTFNFNVIKSLTIGELKVFADFYSNPTTAFTIKDAGAEVRLYNFKYASLSAQYSHNFADKSDSATLSVSGSLTRGGTCKSAQRTYATIKINTFVDRNNNGIKDDGDEPIDTVITVNKQLYETQHGSVLISDLVPYIQYEINAQGEMDAEPAQSTYITLANRGELTEINIPFIAMKEIEGQVEAKKEGVVVKLTDDLGKIRTMKSIYDGYYLFRVPSDRTYTLDEEKPAVKPVPAVEAPKPIPAPVEVQKPAEPVKQKSGEPQTQEQPKSASQTNSIEEPETGETDEDATSETAPAEQVEIEFDKENPIDVNYGCTIKVYRLPNAKTMKNIIKILNDVRPVHIVIHGYAKDKKSAWKLAKQTERKVEKFGFYIRGLEGYKKK